MNLPHVTMPLLVIQPKHEEALFWQTNYQTLRTLDAVRSALFVLMAPVQLAFVDACTKTLPFSCAPMFAPLVALSAGAVVQAAVLYWAPGWWRRCRWHVTVASRLLFALLYVPVLLLARATPVGSWRYICHALARGACSTQEPLTLTDAVKMFLDSGLTHLVVQLPFLFPLPFAYSAALQLAAGVLFTWLASVSAADLVAVDPRLVGYAHTLCVWLGAPVRELSLMLAAWELPLAQDCAAHPVLLSQTFFLLVCGTVLPLAVNWLVELHAKTTFAIRRQRQLLGRQHVPAGAARDVQGWWRLVGYGTWAVRVGSVLALLYTCLWHLCYMLYNGRVE